MVGLMTTSSKRAYATPRSTVPGAPAPVLTCTSTGDTKAQLCLSPCGVSESWCAQGMFEPSERLWREWGLIPNVNSPLLPSCWGFSFAIGHGVFPHGCSSNVELLLLVLDVGYLLMVDPAKHSHCFLNKKIVKQFIEWFLKYHNTVMDIR